MPSIKFLDGSTKNFPDNVTGIEIAKSISPSLSKDAIAIVIDGIQKDLNFVINNNCEIEIITKDSIIAVSGGQMVEASGGIYPSGTGIGYSLDNGDSWNYKYQSIDPIPADGLYQTIIWGNQNIKQLSVFELKFSPVTNKNKFFIFFYSNFYILFYKFF